jgi:hypothetical protein
LFANELLEVQLSVQDALIAGLESIEMNADHLPDDLPIRSDGVRSLRPPWR